MHDAAIRHLESAANYYAKAGFQNASEYAKATELLLDAYAQMDNAKEEKAGVPNTSSASAPGLKERYQAAFAAENFVIKL